MKKETGLNLNKKIISEQKIIFDNASNMRRYVKKNTINLIITSPPYPMIKMWDQLFINLNPEIEKHLKTDPNKAFSLMNKELEKIWRGCIESLKDGGIICINIGDATRTINKRFQLYPNHSMIINYFIKNKMHMLPSIYWNKPTNRPNKFMGSGMLPSNAYITLETEHILIFRKGGKRSFAIAEHDIRYESAYFFKERNEWFSDIWKLKPNRQNKNLKVRDCDASFPFELPYRLINMFSIKGDIVMDPFLGTGTTLMASKTLQRNGVGIEINKQYKETIIRNLNKNMEKKRLMENTKGKYLNVNYNLKVITKQEKHILFPLKSKIKKIDESKTNQVIAFSLYN